MNRMVQSSLANRLSSRSFWNAEKAIIFRKRESARKSETACGSGRLMMTYQPPATAGVLTEKQRRRPPPKSAPFTLQSQFSQGESMNEEILKSSRISRVAEILQ